MEHENEKKPGYLKGLVTGAIIGGAAALLLAPKKGEELREELSHSKEDLKTRGADLVSSAKEKAVNLKSEAQTKFENIKGSTAEKVEDIATKVEEVSESAQAKVDEVKLQAHLAKMDAEDKIEELTGKS